MASESSTTETVNNEMPKPKIKHDWYQTDELVVVTILAKNTENVRVSHTETTLSVSAKLPSGSDYSLELDLAHEVVSEQCSHKVLPFKIEVTLKKRDGIRWNSLEGSPGTHNPVQPIPREILEAKSDTPKYPSSSKKVKDWDKVEKEIEKQEAAESTEGEAAVNKLFQKIYWNGSDDVRRAMIKSFQESDGTVLSTDWSDVGKRTVTRKTSDGVEWKKWD